MNRAFACFLLFLFVILVSTAAVAGEPINEIVSVDRVRGVVTARNTATGRTFQFKAAPAQLRSLKPGDLVELNATGTVTSVAGARTNAASLKPDPIDPCCGVVSIQPDRGEPINEITGAQPDRSEPVNEIAGAEPDRHEPTNGIVTARNNLTGETFQFRAPGAVISTLKPGMSVALDSSGSYAVVESSATAGGGKETYSFPVSAAKDQPGAGGRAVAGDAGTNDSQYWEVKANPALKGPTGRIVVEYPGTGSLIFHVLGANNRQLAAWYKQGSGTFMPGFYTIRIWGGALQGVPVKKNMDTRMKVGVLKLNIQEPYKLLDASGKTMFSGHPKEKPLIVFPVGDYTIKTKTLEEPIAIKDGQVTEF